MSGCPTPSPISAFWVPPVVQADPNRYLSDYECAVDEKRRIRLPARWQAAGGRRDFELMVIAWVFPGQPPCLLALPPETWNALTKTIWGLPLSDPRTERVRRVLATRSELISLDSVGRLCLPQWLAEAAGIGSSALLVGRGDRFEVFSREVHAGVRAADSACPEEAPQLI